MEDKEKIKQALLKFATTLGMSDENVRKTGKKTIVESLDHNKSNKKTRSKSRKKPPPPATQQQLTALLSNYTDALGSDDTVRESRKKDVLDAFSAQIQAAKLITESGLDSSQIKQQTEQRTQLLDDYMSSIDSMFEHKQTGKKKSVLSEEVQQYIDGRVNELNNQFQQLKISNATTVDGGGGSVAKQLQEGGIIEGNLQIQGRVKPADRYDSPEAKQILDDAALNVNQNLAGSDIATFAHSGDTKVTIDSTGNTTFSQKLSVLSDLYVAGAIRGTIEIDPGARTDENLIPKTDDTYTLGAPDSKYAQAYVNDLSASSVYVSGGVSVDGDVVLGDSGSDSLTINGVLASGLIPSPGSTHDLGSDTNTWNKLHVDNVDVTNALSASSLLVSGDTQLTNLDVDSVGTSLVPGNTGLSIGELTDPWDTIHVKHAYVSDQTTLSGHISMPGTITTNMVPDQNNLSVGTITDPWSDVHAQDVNVGDELSVLGNTTLGSQEDVDQLTLRSQLASDVTPTTGDTYDLGSTDKRWRTLNTHHVDASENLTVRGDATLSGNVHVHGDLRVDGNAYLSAGAGGQINVGDDAQDLVIFRADIGSSITPSTTDTYNLGDADSRWLTLHVQDISATNNLAVSGDVVLGTDTSDRVHINSQIIGDIMPANGGAYDLGSVAQPWRSLYVTTHGVAGDLLAGGNLEISGTSTLTGDVHILGDLRVDGNAYLSAGAGGQINVGDTASDQVVFRADVASDLIPDQNITRSIGDADNRWLTLHVQDVSATNNLAVSGDANIEQHLVVDGDTTLNDLHVRGDLRVDGNAYLSAGVDGSIHIGDSNTDNVVFNADVNSNVVPEHHATYDLGSYEKNWRDVYLTNSYHTGSTLVSGNADFRGNVTIGDGHTDFLDVNALVGSDVIPEAGTGTQQYSTLITGTNSTPVGDVINLFDISTTNGWGVANDGGTFTIRMEIDLSIPVTGFDEYEWKYTVNSTGGTRAIYIRDADTGIWNELVLESFSSGAGNGTRTNAATLSPTSPFITMSVDGIRFEYNNTLPGGEVFNNFYFVLKENGSIIDWRTLITQARWDLGSATNTWGEIHSLSGYFTDSMMVSGDATVRGNMTIGVDNFTDLTINSDIASDLDPNLDNTYSLGNQVQRWKTLYTTEVNTTGLTAGGMVYPLTDGSLGDALVTDGAGNISFTGPNKLYLNIRNDEPDTLLAGKPIYAIGEVGSSGVIKVGCADNTDAAKMPAIGVVTQDIVAGGDGTAVINGVWNYNLTNVTGISSGDTLYVGSGELTNIKPTEANQLIQNIGQVLRANGTGTVIHGIKVSSIDRSNDVPNLSASHVFYGDATGTHQTTLTAAISAQPLITTQDINVTGQLLSAGQDLRVEFNTIDQRIDGLYNYLISNNVNNYTVDSTNLADFLTDEYTGMKSGLNLGDTITLSATNDVYVLSNNIGSEDDDWVLATLKPTSYITDASLTHEKVIDSFLFTQFKSAKYIIEVEDTVSGEMFFTELSVVTNGTTYSITPYGLNYTTVSPFVEFDAAVNTNSLSLKILQASGFNNITDCRLKATRTNL